MIALLPAAGVVHWYAGVFPETTYRHGVRFFLVCLQGLLRASLAYISYLPPSIIPGTAVKTR